MAKMGYITGTGLGRRCDGILEPVSAVVLPAGKSLGKYVYLTIKVAHSIIIH